LKELQGRIEGGKLSRIGNLAAQHGQETDGCADDELGAKTTPVK
jgi:hypothetical protein